MSTFFTPLRELRRRARKSQAQLAAGLCITRSAYSKLEREQTELTVKRAAEIARILKISITELLPMPTPNPDQIGTPAAELQYLRAAAEGSVLDAYIRVNMNYQEPIPFDELDEYCWEYLNMCEIKTREEYEAAGVLITRAAPGSDQAAFEQILRDPGIYSLFQHSTISDEYLLGFWRVFKAKGTPHFEYEDKPFGTLTKRLISNEHEAHESTAMLNSWPEPLCFGAAEESRTVEMPSRPVYQAGDSLEEYIAELRAYNSADRAEFSSQQTSEQIQDYINKLPPVNWTEITQTSEARNIAWELEQVVFYEPDPAIAHLQKDPAEYASTLTRLVGIAWVLDSLTEEQSSFDVLREEAARLSGKAYSDEFMEACKKFILKQRQSF